MKVTTVLAAAILAMAPSFASASCSWSGHSQQVMSCGEGQVYDADTEACVDQVNS